MVDRLTHVLLGLTFALLGVLVGLGGIGLLAAALYQVLAGMVPPAAAAAILGVLALILMAILFLLARAFTAPRKPAKPSSAGGDDIGTLLALFRDLQPTLRKHAPAVAGGAFAAGVVLGISPRARKALWDLITKTK
ncbi:hypothetical protein SAMN05216241_10230 [Limimonas halophila]|uniref:Holin-X, holin superfamily III n=1 Tax=Limimonas halophila TaxID=1082479 RepID=A0A1G7N5C6_9PROT|nr:hypothetical protein [Limimonas halophila]SDF69285.1 hypothetical protein SAMN05216241_10230 [Limimonas halophila]